MNSTVPMRQWRLDDDKIFRELDDKARRALWTSTLPQDEETDPALWQTLIQFFTAAVERILSAPQAPRTLTCRELETLLQWGGSPPTCLQDVVRQMLRRRALVIAAVEYNVDDYCIDSTATSDGFIRRNAADAAKRAMRLWKTSSPLKSRPGLNPASPDKLALSKAIEKDAEQVQLSSAHTHLDSLRTLEDIKDHECGGSLEEARFFLAVLAKSRGCPVVRMVPGQGEYGVKLANGARFEEGDITVLKLKYSEAKIEKAEEKLRNKINLETAKAKRLLREAKENKFKREQAAHVLHERRLSEKQLETARNSKIQVSRLLHAIDEAHSNKEIVGVIRDGSNTLNEMSTKADLTIDSVNNVLDEADAAVAKAELINEQFSSRTEIDDPEVDEMLEALALEIQEATKPATSDAGVTPAATSGELFEPNDLVPSAIAAKKIKDGPSVLDSTMNKKEAGQDIGTRAPPPPCNEVKTEPPFQFTKMPASVDKDTTTEKPVDVESITESLESVSLGRQTPKPVVG